MGTGVYTNQDLKRSTFNVDTLEVKGGQKFRVSWALNGLLAVCTQAWAGDREHTGRVTNLLVLSNEDPYEIKLNI